MSPRWIVAAALITPLIFVACPSAAAGMPAMAGMTPSHGVAQGALGKTALPWSQARQTLTASIREGRVQGHTVSFSGRAVILRIVANAPHHPDMSFEAGGLTNPTLSVAQGSLVTVTLLNMDYGPGMVHGVLITAKGPPYPPYPALQEAQTIARIPGLAPRSRRRLNEARYAEASVRFIARTPGTYYYVCPTPGHAEGFRMYGRLIVRRGR